MAAQPSLPPRKFSWESSYLAAVLETDDSRLRERINVAEAQLMSRTSTITSDENDQDERVAIMDALRGLAALKGERLAKEVSEQFSAIKVPRAGGFSQDPPASS
jgi:hypothetical protein